MSACLWFGVAVHPVVTPFRGFYCVTGTPEGNIESIPKYAPVIVKPNVFLLALCGEDSVFNARDGECCGGWKAGRDVLRVLNHPIKGKASRTLRGQRGDLQ